MFFLSPEIDYFFRNRQQSNARAGQKKTHVFFVIRCLNLMRALILNREKKHSGLTMSCGAQVYFSAHQVSLINNQLA